MPTLAQRVMEMRRLPFPDARLEMRRGKELRFHFSISPGRYGRLYDCVLQILAGERPPRMFVMRPDLVELSGGIHPPHLYDHDGSGALLCLYWPKNGEWDARLKLANTYIAWTAEWLWYFEQWLKDGQWLAGGAHPTRVPRRWNPHSYREVSSLAQPQSIAQ